MVLITIIGLALLGLFQHPVLAEDETLPTSTHTLTPALTATPTSSVASSPSISFSQMPDVVTKNAEFTANITISSAVPHTDYIVKFCNKDAPYIIDVKTEAGAWKNCNYWVDMPIVKTDANGDVTKTLTLRVDRVGSYDIYAKVKLDDKRKYDSSPKTLVINDTPPSNTPTPSLSHTPSPTVSPTITGNPSLTPTPSKKVTPTPTSEPTPPNIPEPTPSDGYFLENFTPTPSSGEVLSGSSTIPAPTAVKTAGIASAFPLIFIGIGGVLMSSPLWLPRLQKLIKKKKQNPDE